MLQQVHSSLGTFWIILYIMPSSVHQKSCVLSNGFQYYQKHQVHCAHCHRQQKVHLCIIHHMAAGILIICHLFFSLHISLSSYTNTCTLMHAHAHTHTVTHMYTYTVTHIHSHTHTHTHTYIWIVPI